MSEIDDLKEKLKEYTEREDEHSLLPRVLLALLENGRRNEEKIANLADALSQAEAKTAEHRTELARELKAVQSLVKQTGEETAAKVTESLSQAESADAERHRILIATLVKSESIAFQRHNESAKELKAAQADIGKLRKIVIWGGIFLALVIPVLVVAAFYLLR